MKKFKSSIGFQLSTIMAILVLISLISVIIIVNHFIRESEGVTAEANNMTLNSRAASSIENELTQILSSSFQILDTMSEIANTGNKNLLITSQNLYFQHNPKIASIMLADEKNINLRLINSDFFERNKIERNVLDEIYSSNTDKIKLAKKSNAQCKDISEFLGETAMATFVSCGEKSSQVCIILFSTELLTETFSLGTNALSSTYLVNFDKEYLVGGEKNLVDLKTLSKNDYLIDTMIASEKDNAQIRYKANNKKEYFGAYKKLSNFDIGVITVAEAKIIYQAINVTTRNNIFLTLIILGFTVLIVLLYTHYMISKPLKTLKNAVQEITKGHFNNSYIDMLNVKRKDEIGVLNSGISDEREFLNTFSHFTNPSVASAIATKSINFEPNPKDVTIFFSDIRGFTAISDDFKKKYGNDSANKIIGFLNDYMARMVLCVTLSHGNIDKFEGDAIMAVWGLLRNEDLSFENLPDGNERRTKEISHLKAVKEDAVNCIMGSLAMRYSLMEYNKMAKNSDFKPEIKIGCGINTGRASVGLMGCDQKMEYTSIGDAVNFASRTESSNKPCGTDILISEDTYNLLKNDYIRCEENNFTIKQENSPYEIIAEMIPVSFEVKGKGTQHFYGVVNMPQFDIQAFFKQANPKFVLDNDCKKACGKHGPTSLAEVRKLLGIKTPDFSKVNLNADENKVAVKN